ncbi:MAG TPA: hypothetical protein VGM82_03645 [Gemmatimonadaceae bacterium]|jgi:hypothetical protein
MIRPARAVLGVLALTAIAGCEPYSNMVTLAPSPSPDSLAFHVSALESVKAPATGVFGFSVVECANEASRWTIASDGSRTLPGVVYFGQPLPGFIVRTPARALTPGCYKVLASGARPLRINVGADGAAHVAP